jgi:hypothetical protein
LARYIQKISNCPFLVYYVTAPTKGPLLYDMILAQDAVQGAGNPLYSPSDCQLPSLFNKLLVQGKLMICTFSFNFIFGGASMQQVVTTLEALGAAGLVMVVESDVAGSKFDPIPLTIPGIVIIDAMNSEANPLVPLSC